MNNANVYPLDSDSDFRNREPEPMPQTKARRAVKSHKAQIKRLQREIRIEEQRIALARLEADMEARLRTLREDNGQKTFY